MKEKYRENYTNPDCSREEFRYLIDKKDYSYRTIRISLQTNR